MSSLDFLYYLINLLITSAGRLLDLLSTYYITPNLELETNRIISKLGWKGSILLQVPLILLGAFYRPIAIFFLTWSIIVASSNIAGAWFVRNIPGGDSQYAELLKASAKKTNIRNIILDEAPPLILYFAPNCLLWLWIQLEIGNIFDLIAQETFISYILIISGALMLHGIMSFIRNIRYILRLRSESDEIEEKPASFTTIE